MTNRAKVCIVSSSADQAAAAAMDELLRSRGAKTYVEDRESADDLDRETAAQAVPACDTLLLLWSEAAARDETMSEQSHRALEMGKSVVACTLDKTPPPDGVQHPVAAKDHQEVLRAVLGEAAAPHDPSPEKGVAAGRWRIEVGGVAEPWFMAIELKSDGQFAGSQERMGMHGTVEGRWHYDAHLGVLSLELESRFGLTPNRYTLRIELTGVDGEAVLGEDLHSLTGARTYRLSKRRV